VEILVHAAAERAAHRQPQTVTRNDACLARDGLIGEKDTRGVVADIAAVQQVPAHAVSENGPTADEPCIEKVQALVAWPRDRTVWLGDKRKIALADGELRWTYADFQGHGGNSRVPPVSKRQADVCVPATRRRREKEIAETGKSAGRGPRFGPATTRP